MALTETTMQEILSEYAARRQQHETERDLRVADIYRQVPEIAAIDEEKKAGTKWLKDCRIWMYRGAWAEWEIENIEMCVPMSPEELRAKRNSILKHQSQMESAPFLGNDERLFWQRAEDRNRGTAKLYDDLGLACYEAMEAFVEYKPL